MNDIVHELVEDALRELADASYQRKLWLAADGPEVSSLEECISRLWNDSGLGLALDGSQPVVYSSEIDDHLRELRRVLSRIDPLRPPETILEDPSLHHAQSAASKLLQDIRELGVN